MDEYEGREKRRNFRLNEEEMEAIVERAANLAARRATDLVFERMYGELGKGIATRIVGVVLVAATALMSWLAGRGYFK